MNTVLLAVAVVSLTAVLALLIVLYARHRRAQKEAQAKERRKLLTGAHLAASGFSQLDVLVRNETAQTYQAHGLEKLRVESINVGMQARSEFDRVGGLLVSMFRNWYEQPIELGHTPLKHLETGLEFYRGYDQLRYCRALIQSQIDRNPKELLDLLNETVRTTFDAYVDKARNGNSRAFQTARQIYIDAGANYDLATIHVEQPQLPPDWDELKARYGAPSW